MPIRPIIIIIIIVIVIVIIIIIIIIIIIFIIIIFIFIIIIIIIFLSLLLSLLSLLLLLLSFNANLHEVCCNFETSQSVAPNECQIYPTNDGHLQRTYALCKLCLLAFCFRSTHVNGFEITS